MTAPEDPGAGEDPGTTPKKRKGKGTKGKAGKRRRDAQADDATGRPAPRVTGADAGPRPTTVPLPPSFDGAPAPVGVAPGPAVPAGRVPRASEPAGTGVRPAAQEELDAGPSVVGRIDALRDRVAELLALAEDRAPSGPASPSSVRVTPARPPTADAPRPPAHPAPPPPADAPGPSANPAPSPAVDAPRPSGSAVLVARELLRAGMAVEGVRSRLRDGYGVADPDVVVEAASGASDGSYGRSPSAR